MNVMTGDPNQENRPSVFGVEPYPTYNFEQIDWSRIPETASAMLPPDHFTANLSSQLNVGNFSFFNGPTPPTVHFPFPSNSDGQGPGTVRCKRKTESPPLQASKQHITEEKMAEHMSRLHISSETAASSKETDSDRTKRLYMCAEMRKLQHDTILPQSLLSQIHRPCTALVLWTPPRRLIPDDSNNGNNNEESVPDRMSDAHPDANNMELDNN